MSVQIKRRAAPISSVQVVGQYGSTKGLVVDGSGVRASRRPRLGGRPK